MKTAKIIAIVVLILLVMLLIVQNTAPVSARFLWITAEMPVIILLLLSTAGGFALGLLAALWTKDRTPKP